MASSTTAERIQSPAAGGDREPMVPGAPRRELRWLLLGLFAVAMGLTATRSLNYVPYWTIPMVMVWFRPVFVAKVLVFFVGVLLLIGGLLTTYRAGMAYEQWPRTGESWMHEYPLSRMLEDGWGGILEHSHRLWASALGLVAIGAVASAHVHRARRGLVAMAWATLLAITIQGIIGGTRVLEVSQNLAFLHGVIAQAVVAMIVVFAVMASRAWTEAVRTPSAFARAPTASGPGWSGCSTSSSPSGHGSGTTARPRRCCCTGPTPCSSWSWFWSSRNNSASRARRGPSAAHRGGR